MSAGIDIDLRAQVGDFQVDFQLKVAQGPVALVGPNGAGKTTLLRILAGAIQPIEGHIVVGGRVLVDTTAGVCLPPEAREVGYLPQGYGLFAHLTALENVAYGMRHLMGEERRKQASSLREQLGVEGAANRRPSALSAGEKQRVALARALATSPQLLLLDEPTAALDVTIRRETRTLLDAHFRHSGRMALVISHDIRDLLAWKPTLVLIEEGSVTACDSVAALRTRSDLPFLTELLAPLPSPVPGV